TAHYAICTGIMALGMMLPGMISGKIQELIGYQMFFVWIMISTIPGFIIAALVKIPEGFGMKKEQA
ncbi:MAG: MFS transporter, partial [Bacteroidetes bacterium]|nr:MFS transporter [Bacteroidota bacterium]